MFSVRAGDVWRFFKKKVASLPQEQEQVAWPGQPVTGSPPMASGVRIQLCHSTSRMARLCLGRILPRWPVIPTASLVAPSSRVSCVDVTSSFLSGPMVYELDYEYNN